MFKSYLKPGPGVPKNEPPIHPVLKFFKLLIRKFWDISKVNILYVVMSIPFLAILFFVMGAISVSFVNNISETVATAHGYAADSQELSALLVWYDVAVRLILTFGFMIIFGIGPVSAAATYILKNYTKETHIFIASDFFKHFKTEFKQGMCVFIIDIVVVLLMGIASLMYSQMEKMSFINYFILLIFEIYAIMHLYIYVLMTTFEIPVRGIFKNALILTFAKLPKNLLLIVITAVIHLGLPCILFMVFKSFESLTIFFFLEFVVLPVLVNFMNVFFVHPAIDEIVKRATDNN